MRYTVSTWHAKTVVSGRAKPHIAGLCYRLQIGFLITDRFSNRRGAEVAKPLLIECLRHRGGTRRDRKEDRAELFHRKNAEKLESAKEEIQKGFMVLGKDMDLYQKPLQGLGVLRVLCGGNGIGRQLKVNAL